MTGDVTLTFDERLEIDIMCRRIGDAAKRDIVTKAAKKAGAVVLRHVRRRAPQSSGKHRGTLRQGLHLKAERYKVPGKRVYEVRPNPKRNDEFQRPIKHPGALGGKHNAYGYYPASQEYGYLARKKQGKEMEYRYGRLETAANRKEGLYSDRNVQLVRTTRHGNRKLVETVTGHESYKHPGEHYLLKGTEESAGEASRVIIDTLMKEVEKEWRK